MSAHQFLGGIENLQGDKKKKALELLHDTLVKLGSICGTHYKVVKVISVTGQVVAGTLNTYEVELDDGSEIKQYHVEIFIQVWLKENGTTIRIKCAGQDVLNCTW
ncbi:cystatin-like protein [Drosophila ficusphila]|uniref:cystatin-like protein n=1 Tax=Drosophila ficusphila TaxID=30025 RepID=UPI0007E6F960|nr:cystatin-like protein [Drosophila ficusphila]